MGMHVRLGAMACLPVLNLAGIATDAHALHGCADMMQPLTTTPARYADYAILNHIQHSRSADGRTH